MEGTLASNTPYTLVNCGVETIPPAQRTETVSWSHSAASGGRSLVRGSRRRSSAGCPHKKKMYFPDCKGCWVGEVFYTPRGPLGNHGINIEKSRKESSKNRYKSLYAQRSHSAVDFRTSRESFFPLYGQAITSLNVYLKELLGGTQKTNDAVQVW